MIMSLWADGTNKNVEELEQGTDTTAGTYIELYLSFASVSG